MTTQLSGSASVAQPQQFVATTDAASLLSAEAQTLWQQAISAATSLLAELLTRADRDTLLNEVFGRAGTEATVFEANKQALLEAIGTTGLRIAIDLRSGTEMGGATGAYAQVGPNGHEMIYVNADWINAGNPSLEQLTAVVLEEYGHALDVRLNPGLESAGDEGELFADLLLGNELSAEERAATEAEDDNATLTVDGQTVVVEQAASAAPTSTTLGAVNTLQTINRATAQAINLGLTFNASNNQGSDILVAAFNGTTLIGWTIYDRSSDLDAGSGGSTRSIAVTFNLAQFNTNVSAGSLSFRYWQGSAAGTAGNDNLSVTQSGSSTAPFRVKETLENQAHPRENTRVSAGADWAHGRQAAWIWRLRTVHRQEAHQAGAIPGRDGEGGAVESAD